MSRLSDLLGGTFKEIVKELEPIIVKVLESYLIGLLSRATGSVSAMRNAGLLGAGAESVTGSGPTREQAGVLFVLDQFIRSGVHPSALPVLQAALLRQSTVPPDSPDSATGGGTTAEPRSE